MLQLTANPILGGVGWDWSSDRVISCCVASTLDVMSCITPTSNHEPRLACPSCESVNTKIPKNTLNLNPVVNSIISQNEPEIHEPEP